MLNVFINQPPLVIIDQPPWNTESVILQNVQMASPPLCVCAFVESRV